MKYLKMIKKRKSNFLITKMKKILINLVKHKSKLIKIYINIKYINFNFFSFNIEL
jgi:hypothetical protein